MSDDVQTNMPETTPETPDKAAAKPKKMKYFVSLLGLLAVVFLAIPYWYTANPVGCARCHEMEAYYKSWQESPHVTATKHCTKCHVKTGAVNLWLYRVAFYREIYANVTGSKLTKMDALLPGTNSCHQSGCHSLNRLSSASGDIRIDHRNHTDKAHLTCMRCHPGAAHLNAGKRTPARKMCKQCHQAVMDNCGFCHLDYRALDKGFQH